MIDDIRLTHLGRRRDWRFNVTQWVVVLAMIALPRAALAKEITIAIYLEGPDAAALRNVFLATVPPGTTVAEADTFSSALAQRGQKLPFGKSLDGDGRDRAVARVRGAVAAAGLDAALIGRVYREKGQRTVKLLFVRSAQADAPRDGEVVLGPKKSREDAGKVRAFVETTLEAPEPAAASEKPAAEKPAAASEKPATQEPPPAQTATEGAEKVPPEAAAKPPSETPAGAGPDSAPGHTRGSIASALFDVEIGAEAGGRNFAYNDGITNNLRSFAAFPIALVEANAEVFPFADSASVVRNVGLVGSYSRSLFLTSAIAAGPGVATRESSYLVGVRVRVHPNGDSGFVLGVSDGYASQSVDFDSSKNATIDSQVPAVSCSGNRVAVDVRIPVGSLALLADFGYRAIFDQGTIASRFRGSSAGAIDAEAGGALSLARGWEVRAVADYERYFYAFKPTPGDAFVAGGALDQFFGGRLAVAFIY